jgi:hypothetical protein
MELTWIEIVLLKILERWPESSITAIHGTTSSSNMPESIQMLSHEDLLSILRNLPGYVFSGNNGIDNPPEYSLTFKGKEEAVKWFFIIDSFDYGCVAKSEIIKYTMQKRKEFPQYEFRFYGDATEFAPLRKLVYAWLNSPPDQRVHHKLTAIKKFRELGVNMTSERLPIKD